MQDSFSQPSADHGVMDLIVDQLEELVVTLVEEIRQRPGVAAAILAAVVGAFIGAMFARSKGSSSRTRSPASRVAHTARDASEAVELAALAFKLIQNPMVRGYIGSMIERQFKKRAA